MIIIHSNANPIYNQISIDLELLKLDTSFIQMLVDYVNDNSDHSQIPQSIKYDIHNKKDTLDTICN